MVDIYSLLLMPCKCTVREPQYRSLKRYLYNPLSRE